MKILFMGTPDYAVFTLKALVEAGHEIVGVVTQPDRPSGRGKRMQYSPVKTEALKSDLPIFQPRRIRDAESVAELQKLDADLAVVVAFGQILPKAILEMPTYGCLNVHASLLPAYRGAAPMQWAIMDGLTETGVTIMKMDEGLDTGDMISVRKVALTEEETAGSLHDKLAEIGAELLVNTLQPYVEGKIVPVPQGETTTEYAKMLTKQMGRIDWSKSATSIERQIRAFSPWPSAFTVLNGKNFKVWRAAVLSADSFAQADPGTVVSHTDEELILATGDGFLSLLEVQMEGKRRMSIADFLRGTSTLEFEKGEA